MRFEIGTTFEFGFRCSQSPDFNARVDERRDRDGKESFHPGGMGMCWNCIGTGANAWYTAALAQ